MAFKKLERFPTRARPSTPIKIAMNFEVSIPAIIRTPNMNELRLATLNKTFELM